MLVHSLSCKYASKAMSASWGEDGRIWKAPGSICTSFLEKSMLFQNSKCSMYTEHTVPPIPV